MANNAQHRRLEQQLNKLVSFLTLSSKEDCKVLALEYLLGLTESHDGLEMLERNQNLVDMIVELTKDKSERVQKDAWLFVLNASGVETIAHKLGDKNYFEFLIRHVVDKQCKFSDIIAMLLSNLTLTEKGCETCLKSMENSPQKIFNNLLNALITENYNKDCNLHHLAAFILNMTRIKKVRLSILDKSGNFMSNLLPYIGYEKSVVRRRAVVGIIRNCCFEYDHHDWLLSDDVNILSTLLLPLAGPEELSDSENDGLPLDLQYLDEDKKREIDPDIRKMLLECLLMLCSTKSCRKYIKDKNTYVIIRELHKSEVNENVCKVIEKVVQVLIGEETEEHMANFHEVEIPHDILQQLELK